MKRKTWQVWKEIAIESNLGSISGEELLFEGGKVKAHKYYKENGGDRASLHIGYLIEDDEE